MAGEYVFNLMRLTKQYNRVNVLAQDNKSFRDGLQRVSATFCTASNARGRSNLV